jgi:PKD repeat protein
MKNLWIIALTVLIISCTPQPEACFTANSEEIAFGGTLTLNNCSKHAGTIDINWKDGLFEEQGVLSHQYTLPGEYSIDITVWSNNQKKYDETTVDVTVLEPDLTLLRANWHNYLVEVRTPSADETVAAALAETDVVATDLGSESLYTLDTDFDYSISDNNALVTNENDETESLSWSSAPQAVLWIGGYKYNVVTLSSTEMILRTNDATQFEKYDYNNEYETEDFDGYFLFYFRK